jgi:type VII secretion-associated serine protease mycosin
VTRLRRAAAAIAAVALCSVAAAPPAHADTVRDREWYLGFLHIPDAQHISQGDGVTVAVIDTGVNANQPELSGNVLPGFDSVANDNGWVDFDGHGTAVASLIAAHGTTATDGTLGIAPKAKILPITAGVTKIEHFALVNGIGWAVRHGAKVINISVLDEGADDLRVAIDQALAADVVVVAGVGNAPDAGRVGYPAAYPGVIAAAGVDRDGNHAAISVTGPEAVLAAPAVELSVPWTNGQYVINYGTSFATAIISGVVALVRAKYPTMPAAEVVHRLIATAIDKGPPGRDDQYGYGIVNPVAALTADIPPLAASPTETTPTQPATTSTAAQAQPITSHTIAVALAGILVTLLIAGAGIAIVATRTRR